jgi:hypothetical protein
MMRRSYAPGDREPQSDRPVVATVTPSPIIAQPLAPPIIDWIRHVDRGRCDPLVAARNAPWRYLSWLLRSLSVRS